LEALTDVKKTTLKMVKKGRRAAQGRGGTVK
jgi:hypothetical protein